jgi:adenine C2-methylase RlmN of 23S rRNA A2503 and tRNA A37
MFELTRQWYMRLRRCRTSGRKVLIEYCVIGGVNDGEGHAHELGQLLSGRAVVLPVRARRNLPKPEQRSLCLPFLLSM